MKDQEFDIQKIDPIIHERVRLAILVLLAESDSLDYNSLKRILKTSDGNLVSHLRKLEDNGLISVTKSFKGRRPRTTYSITDSGRARLSEYLAAMRQLLSRLDKD